MRIRLSILWLIGSLISLSAQESTYESRRDWFVGRYEGFYCEGLDTADAIWYPETVEIVYFEDIYDEYDFEQVKSSFTWACYRVCEDSIMGHVGSFANNGFPMDSCYIIDYLGSVADPFGSAILYPDSTLEHWWFCPPAYCPPNGVPQFFRGKMVESYANAVRGLDKPAFKVFPNPAKNKIQVKLERLKYLNTDVKIIDVTGKLSKLVPISQDDLMIDVSDLQSGVYFIKVGSHAQKLLIDK